MANINNRYVVNMGWVNCNLTCFSYQMTSDNLNIFHLILLKAHKMDGGFVGDDESMVDYDCESILASFHPVPTNE